MANGQTSGPVFTQDFEAVQAKENEYLKKRRIKNGLGPLKEDPDRWGLALSGGGIRSATFGLGLMQALIKANRMKRFDYLSTVFAVPVLRAFGGSAWPGLRQPRSYRW